MEANKTLEELWSEVGNIKYLPGTEAWYRAVMAIVFPKARIDYAIPINETHTAVFCLTVNAKEDIHSCTLLIHRVFNNTLPAHRNCDVYFKTDYNV